MVVDTSIFLALFFNERESSWVEEQLERNRPALRMSTVNLTEFLILLEDRQPQLADKIREEVLSSGIRFVPPTINQACQAAAARLKYPLNLGDCFAYALAMEEGCPILTLDGDFKKTDALVVIP
jgi:ribonuclease VapC